MQRKAIYLHSEQDPNGPIQWIEGLGNTALFKRSGDILAGSESCILLCYSENNETLYQNSYYNSCYINTGKIELEKRQLVSVLQNQQNVFEATVQSPVSGNISFYDIQGKLIQRMQINQNNVSVCFSGAVSCCLCLLLLNSISMVKP